MRIRNLLFTMMLALPATALAQAPQDAPAENKPTLQQQLMPEAAAKLLAPAPETNNVAEKDVIQPLAQSRGSSVGLIIAGGALFVAGLIVGGDAGTLLAVAGAAVGAYGLYLYF